MQENPGSRLSHAQATTEQSDIERSVVITLATILRGHLGNLTGLSANDIRAIVCASMGVDVRTRSAEYICGAFDTLVERYQPVPRHDPTPKTQPEHN